MSESSEKTFTQEDVNRIVQDRLAEEKRRADTEIQKRDAKIACMEYALEKGYSKDVADLIGSDDVETFKEKAERLSAMMEKDAGGGTGSSGNFARNRKPPEEETEEMKIRRAMGIE